VLSVEYKWTVMEDKKKKGAIEPNKDFEIWQSLEIFY
jgi:hypothetical protein